MIAPQSPDSRLPATRDPGVLSEIERPLLWDLDGTIVDTRRDIAAGVNGMLAEKKLPAASLEAVTRNVGKGVRNLVARCLADAGEPATDEESLDRGVQVFREHYARHLLDTTQPYGDLAETLRELHRRGRRMAIVSNKPEDFSRRIVEGLGLADCFVVLLGGDSLSARKPDPLPLYFAAERCGFHPNTDSASRSASGSAAAHPDVEPGMPIVIGDSIIDLEAARAAGMPICAVSWGYDPEHQLLGARPDWWAESPEELSRWLLRA